MKTKKVENRFNSTEILDETIDKLAVLIQAVHPSSAKEGVRGGFFEGLYCHLSEIEQDLKKVKDYLESAEVTQDQVKGRAPSTPQGRKVLTLCDDNSRRKE